MIFFRENYFLFAIGILLSPAATAQVAQTPATEQPRSPGGTPGNTVSWENIATCEEEEHDNLGTLSTIRMRSPEDATDHLNRFGQAAPANQAYEDRLANEPVGYTRLVLRFEPCKVEQRVLSDEARSWLRRFLNTRKTDKLLQISAEIKPLDVSQTIKLLHVYQEGGSKGETWTTSVSNDQLLVPYFRIDPHSTVSLRTHFRSTREYDDNVVKAAIDLIEKAVAIVNPSTLLVTQENREQFNESSQFVADTVNSFFKIAIDESGVVTRPLSNVEQPTALARIELFMPPVYKAYSDDKKEGVQIGRWTVYADRMIYSVFDPYNRDIDNRLDMTRIDVGAILSFKVADNKSLEAALLEDAAVTQARDDMVAADQAAVGDKGRDFCRIVANRASEIGLVPVDGGAAAWALISSVSLPAAKRAAAMTGCRDLPNVPRSASQAAAPASAN